ncbi:leucyl aminopeptidase family protein [Anderseniella sp. Alg231-50]|uniref:leucyl aminopeptidase family protein n=1 Tax=Anderseniella sp. Alg231-50 TaxID=1922226 RepID=UPI000D54F016
MIPAKSILLSASKAGKAVPVHALTPDMLPALVKSLSAVQKAWIEANGFKAKPNTHLCIAGNDGSLAMVLYGARTEDDADPFEPGTLSSALPSGDYDLASGFSNPDLVALGWILHSYKFTRYLSSKKTAKSGQGARLVCPDGVDRPGLLARADAVMLGRDLINTPAEDMGPSQLEAAVRDAARQFKAEVTVTKGSVLQKKFPLIHAVGRASDDAPRLLDLRWGPQRAPKVTLVGKGVCFDTGGLDLKSAAGMVLMKKDMGGAAAVLSLASMIMAAQLNVRLRVLIPAVENAVAGNAFRPGDVLASRKGLSVEIGNTDAEGRLVLADALDLADAERPELLIDMATLTGAARVALGPDLPPFYTDDDELAAQLARHSMTSSDPVWRLPFWHRYNDMFSSKIADINNAGTGGFAGSITAALFLKRFVEKARCYVHLDIYGWVPAARPGRPAGGEPQAARALFSLLSERYPGE